MDAFCEGIMKAMRDEREATELYLRMAKCAPRRSIGRIVMAIRADERRHREELTRMYNRYCSDYEPDTESDQGVLE